MQSNPWLILGALALFATPATAQDGTILHCNDLKADQPQEAFRAFACLERAQDELAQAQARIDSLEARLEEFAALAGRVETLAASIGKAEKATVPAVGDHPGTRAVVAYVSAKGEKTCPKGWVPYEPAKDRFILGAGAAYPVVGTMGGEAEVTLSKAQMPAHDHRSEMQFGWDVAGNGSAPRLNVGDGIPWENRTGFAKTNSAGGGQAHNNMPPYIALYFCQKAE